jgi:hypothetical protein
VRDASILLRLAAWKRKLRHAQSMVSKLEWRLSEDVWHKKMAR